MAKDIKLCDVCEKEAATVKLSACNAQGEVLDIMALCSECANQTPLYVGNPQEPIKQ